MPIGYFADHELITELGRGDLGVVYMAQRRLQPKLGILLDPLFSVFFRSFRGQSYSCFPTRKGR
jgi:hypothetical protein